MRKSIFYWACLMLVLSCCGDRTFRQNGRQAEPPNFFIFLADDLSRFDIGYYGNTIVRTPSLDEFARESMHFNRMFTPTAMCSPSRSALYTGLYPHRNGCHMNHGAVKDGIVNLPRSLCPLGYRVALAGKRHIKPPEEFPFDYLDFDGVESYLAQQGEPFCIVYASNEPHGPHESGSFSGDEMELPPIYIDTEAMRNKYADYYTDIEKMDREFGNLVNMLKRMDVLENTITIFTSDHGYEYFAKWSCYDAGIHVPFMVRWPGHLRPGSETDALTSYVDVLPTLVDLAGGIPDKELDGKSMKHLFPGWKRKHHRYIFTAHTNRGIYSGLAYPIRGVRDKRYKYIRNLAPDSTFQNILTHGGNFREEDAARSWKSWKLKAREDEEAEARLELYQHRPYEELYDLREDPWELNNLAGSPALSRTRIRLSRQLDRWMIEQGDSGLTAELIVPLKSGNISPD